MAGPNSEEAHPILASSLHRRFWFSPGFGVPHTQRETNTTSARNMTTAVTTANTTHAINATNATNVTYPMPQLNSTLGPSQPSFNVSSSSGKFGLGHQKSNFCFRFNYYGSTIKCLSDGPDCVFSITGLRYDYETRQESPVVSQTVHVPTCLSEQCYPARTEVHGFKNLTSVITTVTISGRSGDWRMDDLSLGWSDNTCEAANCRSTIPDTVQKRDQGVSDRKKVLRKKAAGFY